MAASQKCESPIEFDLFELDARGRRLLRSGIPVELPPQALRMLLLLAGRPNELIHRQEVKETLWPNELTGDFDGPMNFAVKKLREALGDDADKPRYVQTVRKEGYRFIAPVRSQPLGNNSFAEARGLDGPSAQAMSGRPRLGSIVFASLLVLLAIIIGVRFAWRSRGIDGLPSMASASPPLSANDSRPEISSVTAILPQARQRILIRGRGFGLHVPFSRTDSPYLAIRDNTAQWAAGRMIPQNWDEVMVDVESWSDSEIVVSGFSGSYGENGWRLKEGDAVGVAVWNPQNGVGPAIFRLRVASAAH